MHACNEQFRQRQQLNKYANVALYGIGVFLMTGKSALTVSEDVCVFLISLLFPELFFFFFFEFTPLVVQGEGGRGRVISPWFLALAIPLRLSPWLL